MEFKGQRALPDSKDVNKYATEKFKFDYHPKYNPNNDVFHIVNAKTGKVIDKEEKFMPNYYPFGRHLWFTLILSLGDKGLLTGEAFLRYQKIVKQLERTMITEFKYADTFHNEADTIAVEVVKQDRNEVVYRKWGPVEGRKFWQCPPQQLAKRMPVHQFATNVLKLHYERYGKLIDLKLTVPR